MRIVASRVDVRTVRLARPVANAVASWSERTSVCLSLRDEVGRVGRGEAAPLPGYSPDDAASCAAALEAIDARVRVLPDDGPALDIVRGALEGLAESFANSPAARFALETALLDLMGQRRQRSIAACVAGDDASDTVALSAMIGAAGHDASVRAARDAIARGVRVLKAKIGDPHIGLDREIESLVRLRREIRSAFVLRLDANGMWSIDGAREALARLAVVEPEFVEEPARGGDLFRLGTCAVPWAADESLASHESWERLVTAPGCSTVVIKPTVLGGFVASIDLATLAARHGRSVVVTHTFEGPIAHAAACELALALRPAPRPCGLDAHPGIDVSVIPQLGAASVGPSGDVGLGIDASIERAWS
jgi:o-succinylbenzoate synthase